MSWPPPNDPGIPQPPMPELPGSAIASPSDPSAVWSQIAAQSLSSPESQRWASLYTPTSVPTSAPISTPQIFQGPRTVPGEKTNTGTITFEISGPASARDKAAIKLAQTYIGKTPYVWGGTSPAGFDCSGLLQYVWAKVGVKIPRVTYDQWTAGKAVAKNKLRPGDAVFFTGSDPKNGKPGHVGMYIGNGRFIEAAHSGTKVRISSLKGRTDYVGARRYA